MSKAGTKPKKIRDKYIKVQLTEGEAKNLEELLELEGDSTKSNLVRRIIHDRYKEKFNVV
jgi:hypothetical protein